MEDDGLTRFSPEKNRFHHENTGKATNHVELDQNLINYAI